MNAAAVMSVIIDEHYPMLLAGAGPLSDGVPRMLGRGDKSRNEMPPPPRGSYSISEDDTVPMRKARV